MSLVKIKKNLCKLSKTLKALLPVQNILFQAWWAATIGDGGGLEFNRQ